jgi:phosphatidate cytidylyltransferase
MGDYKPGGKTMGKRIATTALGLPVLFFVLSRGSFLLLFGLVLISLIGLHEFYSGMRKANIKTIQWVGYLAVLVMFLFFTIDGNDMNFTIVSALVMILLLMIWVLKYPDRSVSDVIGTWFGFSYVPVLLIHIAMIDRLPLQHAVWLVFVVSWSCDTAAYLTGILFGKTKLCPGISPKKTVEGAIGGVAGSVAGCFIFALMLMPDHVWTIALLGFFGSIVSQMGDLSASLIKRKVGIKDFGHLFPGHGGVLDRFDSILFTAPFVYFYLEWLILR